MSEPYPTILDVLEHSSECPAELPRVRSSAFRFITCAALATLPLLIVNPLGDESENKMPTDTELSVYYGG